MFGIGSPFGDDRIGWMAADAVRAAAWYRDRARELSVRSLDRPGAQLLDWMRGASQVVLIDAMQGGTRGRVRRLDLDALIESRDDSISSHGFGLSQTIALGRALGDLPAALTLFAIEIGDDLDEHGPCACLTAALPVLVEAVRRELPDPPP